MIELGEIEYGDLVTIRDKQGNEATGDVITTDPFCVGLFGIAVPFARRTRTGSVAAMSTVKVIAHQPQLATR